MKKGVIFIFLILGIGFVLATHTNDGLNPNDYFYCHDSDDEFNKDTQEGTFGSINIFKKGETYGRDELYSDDFTTKEDSCVIREVISLGPSPKSPKDITYNLKEITNNTPSSVSGALLLSKPKGEPISEEICTKDGVCRGYEKYEGAVLELICEGGDTWEYCHVGEIISSGREDYLIWCSNGNCETAKVNSCDGGENCGILENYCGIEDDSWFKFFMKNPFRAIMEIGGIDYTIESTVSVEPCANGCFDGACIE